jgi:hypothetical protein
MCGVGRRKRPDAGRLRQERGRGTWLRPVVRLPTFSCRRTLLFDGFWAEHNGAAALAAKRGCYVFAVRNRGLTPIYVGKATKSFKQEAFNPTNRHKYSSGFSHYAKGRPLLYFVVHAEQRGRTNAKQIGQIEDFLIQLGAAKNPSFQNVKGTQAPDWRIKGVIRHGAGARTGAETQFTSPFNIQA